MPIEHPLIDKEPRLIGACLEGDILCDIQCIDSNEELLSGIYIARVDQIANNIKAVFVTIGNKERCYLPYEEIEHAFFTNKPSKKEIAIGDELLVQIVRGPMKTKLATVSTTITLKGHYTIVSTGTNSIGVSKKIIGERRTELQGLFKDWEWTDIPMKIVLRTNCVNVDDEVILSEARSLQERLRGLLHHSCNMIKHTCLYKEPSSYLNYINNQYNGELQEIITDDEVIYQDISNFIKESEFAGAIHCRYYKDDYPLYHLFSLQKRISELLNTRVWLKSGAYLIIEPTEALTVIDVNSGKNSQKDHGDYFLNINLEAGKEIVRQLTLRNISGICIIDFIDMKEEEQRNVLLQYMRQECKKCKIPTTVVDMTKLNLMEITRKKTDCSFLEQILRRKA